MRPVRFAILSLFALAGCSAEPAADPVPSVPIAFDVASLERATLSGIETLPLTLRQGERGGLSRVQGMPVGPVVRWLPEIVHVADLDADGQEDALAFFSRSNVGTGEILYLAWMQSDAPGPRSRTVHRLGDRVQIRASRLQAGVLHLRMIVAGPDDAMCCPTQIEERTYRFAADGSIEEAIEVVGTLSFDEIAGTSWTLERMAFDEPVLTGVEVTMNFVDEGVHGSAGCNTYRGPIAVREANRLDFGPLATTRMACAPPRSEVEDAFLARMNAVESWSFSMGRLALTHRHGDGYASLIFRPATAVADR